MDDPAFQKILIDSGLEPVQRHAGASAQGLSADETARWAPVVKAIGLKME